VCWVCALALKVAAA